MDPECRRVRECLPDEVAGDLPESRAAEVRRHLAGCADCRNARERIEAILASARRLGAPPLSEGFGDAVMARLAVAPPVRRLGWRWRRAAVAAVFVAAASALLITRRHQTPVPPEPPAGIEAFVASLDGAGRRAGRTGAGALAAFADAGRQMLTISPETVEAADEPALAGVLREGSADVIEDLEQVAQAVRKALDDVGEQIPWL